MMRTCPKCEKVYPVGTTQCFECDLSTEQQGITLRTLLRNPAVKDFVKLRAGAKVVRNEQTLRQQQTQ
eukprot:12482098-Alexandrium_andersonii.AAC.1